MNKQEKVVIINTKCANLASLYYSLKRLGVENLEITNQISKINSADRLFLPGVGHAKAVMHNIQQLNLIDCITNFKKPVLGICLGMQVLASYSTEGNVELLKLIPQTVTRINSNNLPLPHMGWNQLQIEQFHPLFKQISNKSYVYFIHSYSIATCGYTIATANYGNIFSAVIQINNFYGVQFHPEKSGTVGSQLLKNFLEIKI